MIALLAFLIIFPLIEIYVMIEVGGMIGAFNTILTIIFTAIAGIYYARIEGINTLRSGILNLVRGTMPFFEIIFPLNKSFFPVRLIFLQHQFRFPMHVAIYFRLILA